MVSPASGSGSRGAWAEAGRFVLSGSGGAGPRFLFSHLFPPHGRRERGLRALACRSATVARRALSPAGPAARSDAEALERTLAALDLAPWREWVLARPHAEDRRGRLTAFLFPPGGPAPDRVVKLRAPVGEGPDLGVEARALERVRGELPEPLAPTVPAVLRHAPAPVAGGHEALVLSRLQGRSGYVELQGAFSPSGLVTRHFREAGTWLGRFHRATLRRDAPWALPAWDELAPEPGDARPEWHRRLEAALEDAPCPRAAGHGDFWVRNLLLVPGAAGGELPGVVDWEHHRTEAPPFEDLFHFAWSYALAYPWRGRRREAGEAFDRAFLRDTVLARGVRQYLEVYAGEAGVGAEMLGDLFRVFLLTRRRTEGDTWTRLYRRLERADRSAFSG